MTTMEAMVPQSPEAVGVAAPLPQWLVNLFYHPYCLYTRESQYQFQIYIKVVELAFPSCVY